MDKTKLFALGAMLIAVAVIFAFSFNLLDSTSLFGLAKQKEQAETRQQEAESNSMEAGLSFTVLKPTVLEASVLSGKSISECPIETEAEILIKNKGNGIAEKVFLEFGPGIKVIACNNCAQQELKPEQETIAKARLCLNSSSPNMLTIGSANSNLIELGLE